MTRTRTIGVVLILMAGLMAAAQAQPGPVGRGPQADRPAGCDLRGDRDEMRLERLAAVLELTDEQKTAIAGLHEKARAERTELRKEIARVRNELQGELLKDSPSEGKVVQLTERIGELRTKLQVDRVKTRLAIRAQLTPEQRDRLLLMDQRPGRGHRHGHGRGDCGGRGPCGLAPRGDM